MTDSPTRDLSAAGPAWAIQVRPPSVVSSKIADELPKVHDRALGQEIELVRPRMAHV
jgi:hypothetical protein